MVPTLGISWICPEWLSHPYKYESSFESNKYESFFWIFRSDILNWKKPDREKFEMTMISLNESSVNHNGLKSFFSYLFIFTTWRFFHKIQFRHIFFSFFRKIYIFCGENVTNIILNVTFMVPGDWSFINLAIV